MIDKKYLPYIFLAFLAFAVHAAATDRLIDHVDPFIGTGGDGFGVGSAYPGPSAPFGMVKPGPDTSTGSRAEGFYHCAGYYYRDKHIRGFSHTRMHGTGAPDYGNIMVMPTIGRAADMINEENYRSKFSHKEEEAKAGYYAVTLKDTGIRVELTAGEHTGHHRYTFPASNKALLVVNASHFGYIGDGTPVETDVKVDENNREVTGWFHYKGSLTGRDGGIKTYFVIKTKFPFKNKGVWNDGEYKESDSEAHGTTAGAVVGFEAKEGEVLELKVAISFISVEQARANMGADAPGWDFDGHRARTEDAWEKLLSRIRIEGTPERFKTIFYTAMYHSMLMPTLFTEAGGAYRGFDGEVHIAEGFRYYSDFSMWDTFRTLHPLLALVTPEFQRDMVVSLIKMYEQGGFIPKWAAGTGYSNCMISTPADSVIADTYLKGITDFDVELAYKGMREIATSPTPPGSRYGGREGINDYMSTGYLPADKHGGSAAITLEHAFNDFALSRLAGTLGKMDDEKMFLDRSKNYRNVWNPEVGFFDGRNADGSFMENFNDTVWRESYTEGTAWQWLWFVPHDVEGLIELLGGREKFIEKLDEFFRNSHRAPDTMYYDKWYWHGNEPDIHAPYLYLWAGRPDRTQEEVRWIMIKKYSTKPSGLDGNDDGGTLSSWFVFSSMGFFPIPATSRYYIGSPIFEKAVINLNNGNTFTIVAENASKKNHPYVQSLKLNGAPLDRYYIEHDEILAGGTLEFEMGSGPGEWGRAF